MQRHDHSYGIIPVYLEASGEAHFLTIQNRTGGHWDFPKGHPEEGEDPKAAALRELREETGVEECKLIQNCDYSVTYQFTGDGGERIVKQVDFFLGIIPSKQLILQEEEVKDAKWLSFALCYQQLTFASARKLLEQANQDLAQLPPELLSIA